MKPRRNENMLRELGLRRGNNGGVREIVIFTEREDHES